ncbi:hypothetical protein BP5796_06250 [Coleophoma crateriformis]|uniref:Myb-like domain-containing protein n=1 Tax=Coleophoma crateriformis TaxID=565419 RepID=A0A3D8RWM2_9HELO|nr:hypothetical protein BP5796_06250 [Coleophoma crateriformis]
MSSMIKKKGAFAKAFKPKAPQARRPVPTASTSTTTRPSVEHQQQQQLQSAAPIIVASLQHVVPDSQENDLPNVTGPANTQQTSSNATTEKSRLAASDNNLKRKTTHYEDVSAEDSSEIPAKRTRIDAHSQATATARPEQSTLIETANPTQQVSETTIPSQKTATSVSQPPRQINITRAQSPLEQIERSQQSNASTSEPIQEQTQEPTTNGHVTRENTQETQPDVDLSAIGPGQANRGSHIVPSASLNADGTSGELLEERDGDSATEKATGTRRKMIQQQEGDVRATIEIQLHRPKRATGEKRPRKKKEGEKKKRQRAVTPEGAEEESLPAGITMADLCKDLKIGKKFSKHDEIRKKDQEKKIKAKLGQGLSDSVDAEGNQTAEGASSTARPNSTPIAQPVARQTVGMQIVDGNIVLDQRTLLHDRHKEAAQDRQDFEIIEENDFTSLTTSGTYMKKVRAMAWSPSDVELFYKCLRSYGTDFQMIATHFPGRNRRQIKLKFNAEEKAAPARITKALIGTPEPIDLEEHQTRAGKVYEEVADIEAEERELEEKAKVEEDAERAKKDAEIRQQKAQITGRGGDSAKENDEADGDASAAPRSKKKGAAAKKKAKPNKNFGGGGEEVEVLGTVER